MKRIILLITLILGITAVAHSQNLNWSLKYGKYSCTASKYNNGSYEFVPRGSFIITKDKKYTYNGFEKPSSGTFTIDKNGNLLFKGGYFDGGKAEKTDREDKFLLVFPSNPDNRWTSSYVK
ncbi:hypothetical protein [Pedobacter flavus]|uniref:Uncharacterized protein n=1 Tax=Pedobacter flavus TaxID=3113906 RepID=A0ABU7H406_9SPHI|nr:hypothetical protein [Pedobacter sp. VNH31]MEE1886005.1 hypothetical protein [Pedobacter sp. VNH31]